MYSTERLERLTRFIDSRTCENSTDCSWTSLWNFILMAESIKLRRTNPDGIKVNGRKKKKKKIRLLRYFHPIYSHLAVGPLFSEKMELFLMAL